MLLNDRELSSEITDLLNQANKAESSGDENNQRVTLEKMFGLFEKLSPQSQETYDLYLPHRNLGRLYFISNEYEKALYHLEAAKESPAYSTEEFLNKCNLDRLIANLKIKIGLKSDSNPCLEDARKMNNSLLEKLDKIQSQSLINDINSDKMDLDAINNGNIKTVIEFEIPPPLLPLIKKTPIKFEIDSIEHILDVEIIKVPHSGIQTVGGAFVEILEDKYGIVNRSKISLVINKFIDQHEFVEIKTFSEKMYLSKALLEATNALNYFIERYRLVTGNFWIETIFFKMIRNFRCQSIIGSQNTNSVSSSIDHLMRVSPHVPLLKDDETNKLYDYLEEESIELWKVLLLDAKDFLLRQNFREAIYAVNGALENYLMLKVRRGLMKAWRNEEKVNEFLQGVPIWEYHKLKFYMDKSTFNQAVKNNVINKNVPSISEMLKEYQITSCLPIKRSELISLIYKIKKKRNEVVHGTEIEEDLEPIAYKAIKNFEKLVEMF